MPIEHCRMTLPALTLALLMSLSARADDARLAVVEFDNGSDDPGAAPLGKGLQSMLTTDLSQVDGITLVERAKLQSLLDELNLGADGVLDPATAAQVGKTLGATHVVAGSFTIVEGNMRLDARLVSVETGEVVLGEAVSGEKDAFFELEKTLVKQLLKSLGEELTPKERAAIARIHTADFQAFSDFSTSIAAYDAERYDEALALLTRVTEADEDFKLAHVTLEQLESLVSEAKQRTQAARIADAESAFAARQAEAVFDAQVVEYLYQVAGDSDRSIDERASALHVLAAGLGTRTEVSGGFRQLDRTADSFALRRAGDQAWNDVWTLMRPQVPERFPYHTSSLGTWFDPEHPIEERFDYMSQRLYVGTTHGQSLQDCKNATHALDRRGQSAPTFAPLRGDELQRLHLERQWMLDIKECSEASSRWVREMRALAQRYMYLGALDDAIAIQRALIQESDDPRTLSTLTHELETSGKHLELWSSDDLTDLHREALLFTRLGGQGARDRGRSELKIIDDGGNRALWAINGRARAWNSPYQNPLFIGDTLVWHLYNRAGTAYTDRRLMTDRASAIRYYGETVPFNNFLHQEYPSEPPPPPAPSFFILEGVQSSSPDLQFNIATAVPDDFWPARMGGPGPDELERSKHPDWGVFIGARDIHVPDSCDPVDPTKVTPNPMFGTMVWVTKNELQLVRYEEVVEAPERCTTTTPVLRGWRVVEVLDRTRLKWKGDSAAVRVTVTGTDVHVQIEREKHTFKLPEPVKGFTGVMLHGPGFMEVRDLKFSPEGRNK